MVLGAFTPTTGRASIPISTISPDRFCHPIGPLRDSGIGIYQLKRDAREPVTLTLEKVLS